MKRHVLICRANIMPLVALQLPHYDKNMSFPDRPPLHAPSVTPSRVKSLAHFNKGLSQLASCLTDC
jgi:hypothetical protein